MAKILRKFDDGLPSKAEIFDYWKDRLAATVGLIDWGEPICWACGFHYGTKYDIKDSEANWQKILRVWEAIPLQKCHIVPRGLGGSDDVSNLFLMCRECHDAAPNTNIPEILFEWARNQSCRLREQYRMSCAFKSFEIPESQWESYAKILHLREFKDWSRHRVCLHRPQSKYGATSHRLTYATLIGLVHFFIRNRTESD